MRRLIQVAKFGGSLLAYADKRPYALKDLLSSPEHYLRDKKEIRKYARETFNAWKNHPKPYELWLSHGVKQYGHDVVKILGVVPEVRKYCKFLSDIVTEIFREQGLPIEQIDLAKTCRWNEKLKIFEVMELLRQGRKVVEGGGVPLSWGTVVDIVPSGYAIMSGDDSVLYTGLILRADESVMYLDVPVSDRYPNVYVDSEPSRVLKSHKNLLVMVNERDKTGGLIAKIQKMEILAAAGCKCQLTDGTREGNIYRSLMGEIVGTSIQPEI